MTSELRPFHLALPVTDLDAAEDFYCGILDCSKGRTASRWIDLNFFGHQVTLHLVDAEDIDAATNPVATHLFFPFILASLDSPPILYGMTES